MSRPAIFLDRDGTLIDDPGYISDPGQVRLLDGVAESLGELHRAGYLLVVITNQSGIGRGLYHESDFRLVQQEVERQLGALGVTLDLVLHCPHTADAGCPCRKPGTALYREAIARLDIDPAASWFVGDRPGDVLAAWELGGHPLMVRTGAGSRLVDEAARLQLPQVATFADATRHLLAQGAAGTPA
ncbi:MAG: HAD family hydrolase [Gemmatimonadota bacterium]